MKIELVNNTFKVIVFDLNGTITGRVSEHPAHLDFRNNYIKSKLGKTLDAQLPCSTTLALEICGLSSVEYYKYRNSVLDWSLFHTNSELSSQGFQRLKELGFKLVLYTDCYGEQIKSTLKTLKMECVFDLIISEEYNMKKPSPKAFKFIADKFSCLPDDLLMVGNDYYKDLLPLKIIGGNIIQIESEQDLPKIFEIITKLN